MYSSGGDGGECDVRDAESDSESLGLVDMVRELLEAGVSGALEAPGKVHGIAKAGDVVHAHYHANRVKRKQGSINEIVKLSG